MKRRAFAPSLLDLVDKAEHEALNEFLTDGPAPKSQYLVYVGYKKLTPIFPVQPLKKFSKEECKALEEKMRLEGKL